MKLPLHAWRRRSVVPESGIPHPPPTGSPPPRDVSAPPYDPDFPITTARPTQVEFTMNMKDMVKEDWVTVKHFLKHMEWRKVLKAMTVKWIWKWYLIAAIAITLTVLITTQHDAVVKFCSPVARQIRSWPAGWMIPLVLLIIVSYPPLVGHEIIGILVGLVWGMGQGFVILAAGTFIGEILLWFSFKWCCTNAAAKFEKKNKLYWSLTQLIREKTFMFVLILRFSAIPGHIVTAVSASAGANYWSYLAAAFLTLPKQLSIVYLGEAFGHKETKHLIVSNVMLLLTIVITGVAAVYVYYQMRLVWKRRELELPSVLGVPMIENPTWADVVEAEKASVEQKENAGDAVYIPELGKEDDNGVIARKPWLAKVVNGSRAWSVPHHMTEAEMREFREEMEASEPIPTVRVETAPRFTSSFDIARTATSTPKGSLQLEIPPDQPSRSTSPGPHSPSRITNSLDLARPGSAIGGRHIADDADSYAYSRGGRRPDYTRMRGESRAALLGRPKDEDQSK